MRILTTAAQVRRVCGIDGAGDFPQYDYRELIPQEVGRALLDGLCDIEWHADRDFLNDDGGFIVVLDSPEEFEQRYFGLPRLDVLEGIDRIECRNGAVWRHCVTLANNETSMDHVFAEAITPRELAAQLQERYALEQ